MRVPPSVPETLVRSTIELRGETGVEWLKWLPALIADCERRWRIKAGPLFSELWVNWVAPANCPDGTRAALKLSFPEDKEFKTEAEALRLFDGRGSARLLRLDLEAGAMLLETCEPGTPLTAVEDDEEATSIAAGVMGELWCPVAPEHPFPSVADWAKGFDRLRQRYEGGTGPMPEALVARAEALFAELVASQTETLLLHGDLHHENILSAGRRPWLAIDPKGVVGEPAYDTAALLHNPVELLREPEPGRLLQRRIDLLSDRLNLDRARVHGWGLAQAVLAAYWGLEDSRRVWQEALTFAELLSARKV